MLLRNISPLGALRIPIVGRDAIPAGGTFEVPDEVAGRRPSPASGQPKTDTYVPADPGSGLLAQVGNFEPVEDEDI